MRSLPRGFWILCAGVFLFGIGLRVTSDEIVEWRDGPGGDEALAAVDLLDAGSRPVVRTPAVYEGLGIWVDAFDFSPSYQGEGAEPPLTPDAVEEFAALGVRTVYLQAARLDDRAPGRLLEEDLLAEFLVLAHAHDIDVVGWYLPLFSDVDADLDRLLAIADFEAAGHRFDGVAVDIEYIEAVPDANERSIRLVQLSQRLDAELPDEAIGAIVPPPVQLEVINADYWPRFPWRDLEGHYDAWLPMAYWTFRTTESGYRDAYRYAEESTRRMRANLGDPSALVHIIGGIGDETTTADLAGMRRAIEDTGAVGGSLYDWVSLPEDRRRELPVAVPG